MRFVWIDPNFFYLYPNSIQTGGVVQFCPYMTFKSSVELFFSFKRINSFVEWRWADAEGWIPIFVIFLLYDLRVKC